MEAKIKSKGAKRFRGRPMFKKRSFSRYALLSITDAITYEPLGYIKVHIDDVTYDERITFNRCSIPRRGITKAMESHYLYHINIDDALDNPDYRRVGIGTNIPNFFGMDSRYLSVILNIVTEWEEWE